MARVKVAGIFNAEQAVSAAETFALLYRPFTALYGSAATMAACREIIDYIRSPNYLAECKPLDARKRAKVALAFVSMHRAFLGARRLTRHQPRIYPRNI